MLEQVNFDEVSPDKDEYKKSLDSLIGRLVVLQQQARTAGVGLAVLFEGFNGSGRGSRISDLMYNLDARATTVCVPADVDASEDAIFDKLDKGVTGYFPFMQEYWKALGEHGCMTFYDRGWYCAAAQHLMTQSDAKTGSDDFKERAGRYITSIHEFEQQLASDGYVVVKFFVHISRKAQKKRLEALHDDPETRWRVPDKKLASADTYEQTYALYDELLEASNFDFAPWTLVNGQDKRIANMVIAQTLVNAFEAGFAEKREASAGEDVPVKDAPDEGAPFGDVTATDEPDEGTPTNDVPAPHEQELTAGEEADFEARARAQQKLAPKMSLFPIEAGYPDIEDVDHTLTLDRDDYKNEMNRLQKEFYRLENIMYQNRIPLMIVYEGWDAAGKGGNIKRVAQALDARSYTIFPSPAPTPPELAHPFLWRYWTRLPKAGHVGIYDRSWYGRVLVERVEGFARDDEWARAYDEINSFERDMVDWGALLIKFWVDISFDTQYERFKAREQDPSKQWKITDDDWRNRDKYPLYKAAIDDMFRLTSTTYAPWIVLESDDKLYARVKALRIIVDSLRERMGADV